MSDIQDRLEALEEFASVIAAAMNISWLDQQIVSEIAKVGESPSQRLALLRTALLLGDGRERLAKQLKENPPNSPPPPKLAAVDQMEVLRRNNILLDRFDREVNTSKSYATVITGVGYAGLLAIWEGLRDHVGKDALLYSAAGIAISLITFITWEMAKSRLIQKGTAAFHQVVEEKFFTPDFEVACGIAHAKQLAQTRSLNELQPLIFWLSTITGFGSATILILAAIQAATGLKISFG